VKRIKYYLDTTIFNFIFADGDPSKRDITIALLKELPLIADDIYISSEVIREVSRCPEPRRSQLEGIIRGMEIFLLEIDLETLELADRYVKEGIIPERFKSDAIHIASAVVNGIEAIISWNFSHIVKLKTRIMVNGVNRMAGYRDIEICSPEEVIAI
jgi:hypothetical protein